MIKWYPDDEDEPDGDASANATVGIDLHVEQVGWEGSWDWRAEVADVDGDDPHVLLQGRCRGSRADAKKEAAKALRTWVAEQAEALEIPARRTRHSETGELVERILEQTPEVTIINKSGTSEFVAFVDPLNAAGETLLDALRNVDRWLAEGRPGPKAEEGSGR